MICVLQDWTNDVQIPRGSRGFLLSKGHDGWSTTMQGCVTGTQRGNVPNLSLISMLKPFDICKIFFIARNWYSCLVWNVSVRVSRKRWRGQGEGYFIHERGVFVGGPRKRKGESWRSLVRTLHALVWMICSFLPRRYLLRYREFRPKCSNGSHGCIFTKGIVFFPPTIRIARSTPQICLEKIGAGLGNGGNLLAIANVSKLWVSANERI